VKRFIVCVAVLAFLLAGTVSAEEKKCGCGAKAKAEVNKAECPKAAAAKKAECPKAAAAKKACCAMCQAKAKAAEAKKKAEAAKKKAHAKAAHGKKGEHGKEHAKKVNAKTGTTPKVLKQYATMEKQRLAKLTHLLKRIQNIARQEKAEKTVAAIDNAIKREIETAKKRFAHKAAAFKKQKARPAAKKAPAKKPAAKKPCCGTCQKKEAHKK